MTLIVAVLPMLVLLAVLLSVAGRTTMSLKVVEGSLIVNLGALDGTVCLRRRITVPRAEVKDVQVLPARLVAREGLRLPGTAIPGLIRAGSYGRGPDRTFWNVRRADIYLVVDLCPEGGYRQLVLEVQDPAVVAHRLRGDLARQARRTD